MYPLVKDDVELERKSFELSEQIRRTSKTEEKERLKNELINVVENHFNVRQERREMELKRLEEQIDRMRESLKKLKPYARIADQATDRRIDRRTGQRVLVGRQSRSLSTWRFARRKLIDAFSQAANLTSSEVFYASEE